MITIRCTRSRGPRGSFCLQVDRRGPVIVAVIPLKLMAKFSVKTLLIMVSLIAVAMTVVVNLLPPPPLHFRYPSSDKIIALAADRADKLNIEITKLGSNIYGLEIGQINRDGQSYKYASAIHAHTFTSDNPDDLSRQRQAEIEGQYASHWRQQAGWRDHCRDLKISRAHFYWMQQNLLNQ